MDINPPPLNLFIFVGGGTGDKITTVNTPLFKKALYTNIFGDYR